MSWESIKLVELYDVHNGLSKGKKYFGSGHPFLTFSTVFNHYFIPDELNDFVQSTIEEQANYSIHRGDIFITRTSETSDELGMSCVALKDYPKATYNGFTKRLRPKTDKVVPEYIGYYMRTPGFRGEFQAFSTMTTRASLRNEDLLNLKIDLPSVETQRKIANILSAYDGLIESNQKQINLLEEAAQQLYKEWFINLHFPGYEDTPVVGDFPYGWENRTIDSFVELLSGFAFKSHTFNNCGRYKIVTIKNVQDGMFDGQNVSRIDEIPAKLPKHCYLSDGDVLLSLTGNVGRICIVVGEDFLLNQRVAKLQSKYKAFTYCLFRSNEMYTTMNNLANGAAQQNLSPIRTGKIIANVPPETILLQFENSSLMAPLK